MSDFTFEQLAVARHERVIIISDPHRTLQPPIRRVQCMSAMSTGDVEAC